MVSSPLTQQNRPGGQPGRRDRGRRTRKLVIIFGLLAALLVGADFGLAAIAEHTVSQKAREQLRLADDPSVNIHGFPFTTQALAGHYGHITVYAAGVPVKDTLRDVELNAELRDVTAPLPDLVHGNTKAIRIGTLEGQVKIKASDIARIPPLNQVEDFKIEPCSEEYVKTGEDSRNGTDNGDATSSKENTDDSSAGVRLSGNVRIAGQQVEVFAFAIIELVGNKIQITPERLQFGNDKETTVVPPQVQKALLPNFKATIDAGSLPFTVTPTAVKVELGSVTLKGEAKNVTFTGASSGA
jgi:hypothetical protein